MADPLFFDDLIAWIESNIVKRLLLSDVTRKAGFSHWYLQRIFKNHTGMTLGLFIRKAQMESVGKEILADKTPITEIALKYGYESQQSFTRAFRRYYGMPPATYRKKFYGKNNQVA